MRSVGELIRTRRSDLGLTLMQVSERAGCAKSYLSTIESGRRDRPPSDGVLERLERALGMRNRELLSAARWESTPREVRREMEELEARSAGAALLARRLSESGLDALHSSGELQRLVESVSDGADVESVRLPMRVPVVNRVAAGYPREFTDLGYPARVADEYVSAPGIVDADAFAARVVGDSMSPEYGEGDIVIFSPERDTPAGTDCFVRLERDDETTFKRVYFEEGDAGESMIRLQPLNAAYGPRVVRREDVAGMYAAVFVLRAV